VRLGYFLHLDGVETILANLSLAVFRDEDEPCAALHDVVELQVAVVMKLKVVKKNMHTRGVADPAVRATTTPNRTLPLASLYGTSTYGELG